MKKLKYIVLPIILLSVFVFNNVYGIDLKYQGSYINPKDTETDKTAIYIYFCVKNYSKNTTTDGWVDVYGGKSSVEYMGSEGSYNNPGIMFTGIPDKKYQENTYSYKTTNTSVKDTEKTYEYGGLTSYYDTSEVIKVPSDSSAVNINSVYSGQTPVTVNCSKDLVAINSRTGFLCPISSITEMELKVDKAYDIRTKSSAYHIYIGRITNQGSGDNYHEDIEEFTVAGVNNLIKLYAEKYGVEEDEIREALNKTGVRFTKRLATKGYKWIQYHYNIDTPARALYIFQNGSGFNSRNTGFSDWSKTSSAGVGYSMLNNFDNIMLFPLIEEKEDPVLYVQYWVKELDDNDELKEAIRKPDLPSESNPITTVTCGGEEVEALYEDKEEEKKETGTTDKEEDTPNSERMGDGDDQFDQKFKLKADVKTTIESETELEIDGKKYKINKKESKYAINTTFKDTLSDLKKSTKKYSGAIGKTLKTEQIMLLKVVYDEIPEDKEEEDPEGKLVVLEPFKLKCKLQFISVANTDTSFNIIDGSIANDEQNNSIDGKEGSLNTFEFYNSTRSETQGTLRYDYIPSEEYVSPYGTDAYSYLVRSVQWLVRDEPKTITSNVKIFRNYDYILRWAKPDGNLPRFVHNVSESYFYFTYGGTKFLKVWSMDEAVCPYAKNEYDAYDDHLHSTSCCRGMELTNLKYSFTVTCGAFLGYDEVDYYDVYYNGYYGKEYIGFNLSYSQASEMVFSRTNNTGIVHYLEKSGTDYIPKYCQKTHTFNQNNSYADTPYIYHTDGEVKSGFCWTDRGGKSKTTSTYISYSKACSCGNWVSGYGSYSVTGTTVMHTPGVKCGYPYETPASYSTKDGNVYPGHVHTVACFNTTYEGDTEKDLSQMNGKTKEYIKYVSDPDANKDTTGIDCSNEEHMDEEIKRDESYTLKYIMKYYTITNFKMYKIKDMLVFDNKNPDVFYEEELTIIPSENYDNLFSDKSGNGLVKINRKFDATMGGENFAGAKLEFDLNSTSTFDGEGQYYGYDYYNKEDNSNELPYSVGNCGSDGNYIGAGGKENKDVYADAFVGYRDKYTDSYGDITFELPNIFLADSEGKSEAQDFVDKVEESVKAITRTEVALRLGVEYKVTDMMNDYFKFSKQYGENAGDLNHHDNYENDKEMFNRNKKWEGTVTYNYSWKNGMKTQGKSVYSKDELMKFKYENDKGEKDGNLVGAFEINKQRELNKLFDATNFSDTDEHFEKADGNTDYTLYEASYLEEKDSKDNKGSKSRKDISSNPNSSETYTKKLINYTDNKSNTKLTDIYDWSLQNVQMRTLFDIDDGVGNGKRELGYKIEYELVEGTNFNRGEQQDYFTNFYHYGEDKAAPEEIYLDERSFKEQVSEEFSKQDIYLNVLTPVSIKDATIVSNDLINHTTQTVNSGDNVSGTEYAINDENLEIILGKDSQFTINFNTSKSTANVSYGIPTTDPNEAGVDTLKYTKEFWVRLDFDSFCYSCKEHTMGGYHPANSIIKIAGTEPTFTARTTGDYGATNAGDLAVKRANNKIELFVVAANIPKGVRQQIVENNQTYYEKDYNRWSFARNQQGYNYSVTDDTYHVANGLWEATALVRIFGFAITDFADIGYKNIFRDEKGYATTGNYFAGKFRWAYEILTPDNQQMTYDESNKMVERESNISDGRGFILPVGPYSNGGYVYAPKLGYRFSFDFRTIGYFQDSNGNNLRTTTIVPSYYYISKDGTTFKDNIELYYKDDASGIYKKFINSGYKIAFKPNNGYRNLRFVSEINYQTYLSDQLQYIDISNSSGFTLNNNFMTTSYNNFMQTWYGEFKLPNSTIAVEKDGNLNQPLTDGYIGVRFAISCYDSDTNVTMRYDQNNSSQPNTSQWDYEGNFGFENAGNSMGAYDTGDNKNVTINGGSLSYRLEKGNWNINNATWQNVKSTVVLYDTDLRAEDDFQ